MPASKRSEPSAAVERNQPFPVEPPPAALPSLSRPFVRGPSKRTHASTLYAVVKVGRAETVTVPAPSNRAAVPASPVIAPGAPNVTPETVLVVVPTASAAVVPPASPRRQYEAAPGV